MGPSEAGIIIKIKQKKVKNLNAKIVKVIVFLFIRVIKFVNLVVV